MKQLFFLILPFLLASCASHHGNINNTHTQTDENHTYVDLAVGYSKATYVFGIGGLNKDMLFAEAYRNMRMSYPLEPNQTLENLVVNSKRTRVGPVLKHEVITIADVVAWDNNLQIDYSDRYLNQFSKNKILSTNDFKLNDQVLMLDQKEIYSVRIVSLSDKNAVVFYIDKEGDFQLKKLNLSKLYWGEDANKQYNDYKVGDRVMFKKPVQQEFEEIESFIRGLNQQKLLVFIQGLGLRSLEYDDIKKPDKKLEN
ncbi:DUF6567 family protein [Salinivirga cyanobacteriivorans]